MGDALYPLYPLLCIPIVILNNFQGSLIDENLWAFIVCILFVFMYISSPMEHLVIWIVWSDALNGS